MHRKTGLSLLVLEGAIVASPARADLSSFPLPDSSNAAVQILVLVSIAAFSFYAGAWVLSLAVKTKRSRTGLFFKAVAALMLWPIALLIDAPLAREQRLERWGGRTTKAKQDLDMLRNAINLYESRFQPLVGAELRPLLDQTLLELPKDPWGADDLLDTNLGIVWSYGADGHRGGSDSDADVFFAYKPRLQVRRAEYEGAFGVPGPGNKLTVHFTKPFRAAGEVLSELVLVPDVSAAQANSAAGRLPFSDARLGSWTARPDGPNALIDLVCTAAPADRTKAQVISPRSAIDVGAGAYAILRVDPVETRKGGSIRAFGAEAKPPTSAPAPSAKVYPGYPEGFNETGAIPAENQIGARVERKS